MYGIQSNGTMLDSKPAHLRRDSYSIQNFVFGCDLGLSFLKYCLKTSSRCKKNDRIFIRRNRIDVTQHVSDNVSYRQKDISPKSLYNHLEIYSSLRRSRSPINSEIKSYLNNKNPNAEDLFSIIQELKGEYPRMFR